METTADPTERAVKALLGTYWSSSGWREDRKANPADLAQAVAAGVMFDDTLTVGHSEVVSGVVDSVARVSARDVADAFVSSLGRAG